MAAPSNLLQTVAADAIQEFAILQQRAAQRFAIAGGLLHSVARQLAVAIGEQPGAGLGVESHPIEHVLIARRGKHLFAVRKVLVPGTVEAPELQPRFEAVGNGLAAAIVAPEVRVLAAAEDIVKLE